MNALDDEPLTLADACREVFKDRIGPASLRAEAARGRLVIEKVGRTHFVTRAAIREMREKCRVVQPQKAPVSGFSRNESAPMAPMSLPSGASATMDDTSVALASVLLTVEALSKNSRDTSPKTTCPKSAKVIRLKP